MLKTYQELGGEVSSVESGTEEHTLQDLGRMFSNSIVRCNGKLYVCTGNAVKSATDLKTYLEVYTKGLPRYTLLEETDISFPEVGYYNIVKQGKRRAILISRKITGRSWRYAFHPSNVEIDSPYLTKDSNILRALLQEVRLPITATCSTNCCRSTLSIVYMASGGKFHPFGVAMSSIRRGTSYSIALSRKVAIGASPYSQEVGVFLMGTKVATVNEDNSLNILTEWARESIEEVCHA